MLHSINICVIVFFNSLFEIGNCFLVFLSTIPAHHEHMKINKLLVLLAILIVAGAFSLGLTVGFNTNKILYIEGSTYHSPIPHSKKITEDSQINYREFPVEIVYSQSTDSGSDVKVATSIFAAVGEYTTIDQHIPVTTGRGPQDQAVVMATVRYSNMSFHAYVAKGDDGRPYMSLLALQHPDGGCIYMTNNSVTNIKGSTVTQEELRKAAKLILDNL